MRVASPRLGCYCQCGLVNRCDVACMECAFYLCRLACLSLKNILVTREALILKELDQGRVLGFSGGILYENLNFIIGCCGVLC